MNYCNDASSTNALTVVPFFETPSACVLNLSRASCKVIFDDRLFRLSLLLHCAQLNQPTRYKPNGEWWSFRYRSLNCVSIARSRSGFQTPFVSTMAVI